MGAASAKGGGEGGRGKGAGTGTQAPRRVCIYRKGMGEGRGMVVRYNRACDKERQRKENGVYHVIVPACGAHGGVFFGVERKRGKPPWPDGGRVLPAWRVSCWKMRK